MPEPIVIQIDTSKMRPRPRVPITRAWIENTPLRQTDRVTYPDGSGRVFEAGGCDRLTYVVRSFDGQDRTHAFWLVDDVAVESIDHAVEALAAPRKLSPLEARVLERVPADWTGSAGLHAAVMGGLPTEEHDPRRRVLVELYKKGLIEVESNAFRRVAVG